jgi:hypothetical protein
MNLNTFEKSEEFSNRYASILNRYHAVLDLIKDMESYQILERIVNWVSEVAEPPEEDTDDAPVKEKHRRLINPGWLPGKQSLYREIATAVIDCMPAPVYIEGDFLKPNPFFVGPGVAGTKAVAALCKCEPTTAQHWAAANGVQFMGSGYRKDFVWTKEDLERFKAREKPGRRWPKKEEE